MKEMEYSTDATRRELLSTGYCFGLAYYILNLGTHPTAYVRIPNNLNIDINEINVHGGITYNENHLYIKENLKLEGGNIIGWDYAHYGDYLGFEELPEIKKIHEKFKNISIKHKKWTTKEIYEEVKNVCYQIRKIEEAGEK